MKKKLTKRHILILSSTLVFVVFLVFTYFVATEKLDQFDFDTTVRIQDNIPRRVDNEFSSLSLIGSFEVTLVLFLAMVFARIRKLRRMIILLVFPAFHVIEIIGKTYIDKEPPPFMFLRYSLGFHFPSGYVSTDHYSYPSGHVGRTALLVTMAIFLIWQSKKLKLQWKVLIVGIFVGIWTLMFVSRIYLGEHWTSDVIGGSLLGISFALIAAALW